jgi:hypothetical protein
VGLFSAVAGGSSRGVGLYCAVVRLGVDCLCYVSPRTVLAHAGAGSTCLHVGGLVPFHLAAWCWHAGHVHLNTQLASFRVVPFCTGSARE